MNSLSTVVRHHPDGFRGIFRTDPIARALYSEGAGIARAIPAAVAVPADTEDVRCLVLWAAASGISLMPRGSGTGMAAGAVGPGVVVDLSRFSGVGSVDTARGTIRVGSGALRGVVEATAQGSGLRFPVDPSSGPFCTIGGMVATNAAGPRSLRYGSTRSWVLGLKCVFDDGSIGWIRRDEPLPRTIPAVSRLIAATREIGRHSDPAVLRHARVRKDSSGYLLGGGIDHGGHLIDLLVGSEGTLAFFTEIELRLIPATTETATILATFNSLESATACAVETKEFGASACEMFDRSFLDVADRGASTGISVDAEAALLIEIESTGEQSCQDNLDSALNLCRIHDATMLQSAMDKSSADRLWALRYAASPILAGLAPRLRSMQFIEDGCVPPESFPEYVRGVRKALHDFGSPGVIFGHAGDAHAHVNPLIDTTDIRWRETVLGMMDTVGNLTGRLGGTLTGEHGDGRLRVPLQELVWSTEAREAFVKIKTAADPSGILNAGCKTAMAGEAEPADKLGTVRYDPKAVELPSVVRKTLDEMEKSRGWSRFRLDLVS